MTTQTSEDSGTNGKERSESEKKRRNDMNVLLNEIERLVYTSKHTSLPPKKVGKIQILHETYNLIRFHNKLIQGVKDSDLSDSFIPPSMLQDLLVYSQRGFVMAVDNTGQVVCCSSSTMGFLETTEIVSTKLPSILTSADSDYIMSLIAQRKGETEPFLIRFTMNIPSIGRTFICRAFWHQFLTPAESDETGALILACSSIDKLSIYNLPIFCADNTLSFEFKVSLDSRFTKIDDATERCTGHTSADLLGRCLLDFVNCGQIEELIENMNKALTQGTNATGCLQFCCKSKSWIWIQANIHVSQNVWNSRIDSLIFSCKAMDYDDVITFLTSPPASAPRDSVLPEAPVSS